jgi:hypothetical protein
MRVSTILGTSITLVLATLTSGAGSGDGSAVRLTIAEPELAVEEIKVLESLPPQFEVVLKKRMPSPGWSLDATDVHVDGDSRTVRVTLTETPPQGMAAQVITPVRVSANLGSLETGRWLLEVWARRGGEGKPRRIHAVILQAAAR